MRSAVGIDSKWIPDSAVPVHSAIQRPNQSQRCGTDTIEHTNAIRFRQGVLLVGSRAFLPESMEAHWHPMRLTLRLNNGDGTGNRERDGERELNFSHRISSQQSKTVNWWNEAE